MKCLCVIAAIGLTAALATGCGGGGSAEPSEPSAEMIRCVQKADSSPQLARCGEADDFGGLPAPLLAKAQSIEKAQELTDACEAEVGAGPSDPPLARTIPRMVECLREMDAPNRAIDAWLPTPWQQRPSA